MDSTKTPQNDTHYDEHDIEVLEGLDPVRIRPGMYIGSTDTKGLHHILKEIIDNSVDEALAGFANQVVITIKDKGTAVVSDNGRGIPVGIKKEYGVSALELVMTKLHAGGKFGGKGYKVTGGLHGVGASVSNALSSECRVEIRQNGKLYYQEYRKGKVQSPVKEDLFENSKFTKENLASEERGTSTYIKADPEIFETLEWDYKNIRQQVRVFAFLTSRLRFKLIDERSGTIESFYFEGGVKSFVEAFNRGKDPVHEIPFYIHKEDAGIDVEVALQYTDSYVVNEFSFANNIRTPEGGSHLTGFRSALTRSVNDYAKKHDLLKNSDEKLSGDDTREGL